MLLTHIAADLPDAASGICPLVRADENSMHASAVAGGLHGEVVRFRHRSPCGIVLRLHLNVEIFTVNAVGGENARDPALLS
jgi:hypothetical protein